MCSEERNPGAPQILSPRWHPPQFFSELIKANFVKLLSERTRTVVVNTFSKSLPSHAFKFIAIAVS